MRPTERFALAQPCLALCLLALPAVYIPGLWPVEAAVLLCLCPLAGAGARPLVLAGVVLTALLGFRAADRPDPRWPFDPVGPASGVGTVAAEAPVSRRGFTAFTLRIDEVRRGDWSGRASAEVKVVGFRDEPPATGSRWTWRGVLTPEGSLLWRGGAGLGWAEPWWKARADLRHRIEAGLAPVGEGPAALGLALLIGASDDLTPGEKEAFRKAGCSHVLALSGMHLSLLAVLLGLALNRRLAPWAGFLIVQGVLAAFCFLAGPLPSLLRAWVMAFLAGLWGLTRSPVPLRELLAQSFLGTVALWPDLAPTLSLQLSFLAMAGLFWWGQRFDRALRPWVGRWAAGQLGASAAALAATVPLTLSLFGEVRWIGLILTPPLVFLTTVLLAATALAVLWSFLPGSDTGLFAPVFDTLYRLTFACAGTADAFPPAGPAVCAAAAAAGGLGAGLVFLYNFHRRRAPVPVSLNYDSPASLQAFLESKGYNALKRWGQNFLINAGARRQILAALDLQPGEPVWEVGPGLGALTHHLVEAGHPLTVFEIDPGYSAFLRDEFGGAPAGFSLVEGDVIKTWKSAPRTSRKCVGNLPYNAASAIVADFIEGGWFPDIFVVTVQLEMAERMTASPGNKNYSSFSVLCQSAFVLNDVVTLRPGSFYPAPEVTSRVVRLKAHGRYPGLDHRRFSVFVRECFSSRRKTLRNNVPGAASALHVSDEALTAAFASAGIDLGLRAERLTVDQFAAVFAQLA